MLIIFAGLPGSGKTTIAKSLACKMKAAYLRIDSIEQALIRSDIKKQEIEGKGYEVAYAVAKENLQLGLVVIADSVNPINLTREAWRHVATSVGVPFLEVEIVCLDPVEHRRRVESREADIPNHQQPIWEEVIAREYDAWDHPHLVIDSSKILAAEAVEIIIKQCKGEICQN
jgi:predicted kinase